MVPWEGRVKMKKGATQATTEAPYALAASHASLLSTQWLGNLSWVAASTVSPKGDVIRQWLRPQSITSAAPGLWLNTAGKQDTVTQQETATKSLLVAWTELAGRATYRAWDVNEQGGQRTRDGVWLGQSVMGCSLIAALSIFTNEQFFAPLIQSFR